MEPLAFYCVCDSRHFLGLATLINSLRLVGHHEPIHLLDCGLEPGQRRLVEAETIVETAEPGLHPMLAKNVLPLSRSAEVMVVVDVDVIFTRPLYELVEHARREQKPILFLNDRTDRFKPEWEALGYGPPVPHEYLAVGQYVLPLEAGRSFLELFEEALGRLDVTRTLINPEIRPSDPFYYPEMDVLNALVGTALPLDRFSVADRELVSYWPFRELRVEDETTLDCLVLPSGERPVLLHHILDKPWIAAISATPYTRLMTRLLCSSDVPIRVPRGTIPWRLRSGPAAALVRRGESLRGRLRQIVKSGLRRYPLRLKTTSTQ